MAETSKQARLVRTNSSARGQARFSPSVKIQILVCRHVGCKYLSTWKNFGDQVPDGAIAATRPSHIEGAVAGGYDLHVLNMADFSIQE